MKRYGGKVGRDVMKEERRKTVERCKGREEEKNWGEKEEVWTKTWERCKERVVEKNWGDM